MFRQTGTREHYGCAIKRRERVRRYQASAKGKLAKIKAYQHFNRRRVYIKREYLFASPTVTEAQRINAHIKGRLIVAQQRFKTGTET